MEICFLGTGTPVPDPRRGSSAILVDVGAARILLDCGRNCVQQMAHLDIPAASITHCFLTHGHYDHVVDHCGGRSDAPRRVGRAGSRRPCQGDDPARQIFPRNLRNGG